MIDLRELYVRPGQPVLPAWRRLLEWAKQFRLFAGRGVRLQRTPNGTYVVADIRSNPWNHPFKVRLMDREATIGFGTVQDVVPHIDGKRLDGTDDKGREGEPPVLRLTGEPDNELRSWIIVEAKVDPESGEIDPEDEEAVVVRHVRELRSSTPELGRHPLAMLVWSPNRSSIVRVRQITHFHLRHLFVPQQGSDSQGPQERRGGRHLFWAT
jgi:hypothetical protein